PSDVEVMDTSADAPGNSAFNNDFKVNVNETTLAYTDDFDKAKAEVEKDPGCGFKSWTKAEKTADGWDMEWVCESMIDKSARYGVEVRRTFGEKHYSCWEKLDSAEKASAVVKACT